jgi:hypothetical protein
MFVRSPSLESEADPANLIEAPDSKVSPFESVMICRADDAYTRRIVCTSTVGNQSRIKTTEKVLSTNFSFLHNLVLFEQLSG